MELTPQWSPSSQELRRTAKSTSLPGELSWMNGRLGQSSPCASSWELSPPPLLDQPSDLDLHRQEPPPGLAWHPLRAASCLGDAAQGDSSGQLGGFAWRLSLRQCSPIDFELDEKIKGYLTTCPRDMGDSPCGEVGCCEGFVGGPPILQKTERRVCFFQKSERRVCQALSTVPEWWVDNSLAYHSQSCCQNILFKSNVHIFTLPPQAPQKRPLLTISLPVTVASQFASISPIALSSSIPHALLLPVAS